MIYNWLPVGKKNYDKHQSSCCPCCGFNDETVNHLFQCPYPRMAICQCTAYETIEKYLTHDRKQVPHQVITSIISLDKNSCNHLDAKKPTGTAITKPILISMLHLGAQYFMWGFLTSSWITTVESLTKDNTTGLISVILHLQWKLLLFPLQEMRNNILHKTQNCVTQGQHESCNHDPTLFKQYTAKWLGSHVADYDLNLAT